MNEIESIKYKLDVNQMCIENQMKKKNKDFGMIKYLIKFRFKLYFELVKSKLKVLLKNKGK
jgi:hypothetical protein